MEIKDITTMDQKTQPQTQEKQQKRQSNENQKQESQSGNQIEQKSKASDDGIFSQSLDFSPKYRIMQDYLDQIDNQNFKANHFQQNVSEVFNGNFALQQDQNQQQSIHQQDSGNESYDWEAFINQYENAQQDQISQQQSSQPVQIIEQNEIVNPKRLTTFPDDTFNVIRLLKGPYIFPSICKYYNTNQQKISKSIFDKIIKHVLMPRYRNKRNKKFLLMVFNDIDTELYNKIREKNRLTAQDEYYFNRILENQRYDPTIINKAKQQLREAFYSMMNVTFLRNSAYSKNYKDKQIKQPLFYKYLLNFKIQLKEGKITENADFDLIKNADTRILTFEKSLY